MKKNIITAFLIAIFFMALQITAVHAGQVTDTNSLAGAQGYDLVSYQNGKPQKGNGYNIAEYQGVSYVFVNEENKKAFEADPAKYIPAFGGYCAYGVAVGKKFVADAEVWKIVDGILYLNLDTKIQKTWEEDIPGNIKKANSKWKEIKEKSPFEL
jgi:YHS domain-containing protein